MYGLLIVATALCATQFLFHQAFTKTQNNGLRSVLTFSICTHLVSFFVMLVLNRFQLKLTWFSVLLGLWSACNSLLYSYFGLKALTRANLSVYSIFAMLGGLILPFAAGILFYREPLTVPKLLCSGLIILSLLLTAEKGSSKKGTGLLYLAVFFLNGMSAVISKVHQSNEALCTDSYSFVAIGNALCFSIALVWYLIAYKKLPKVTKREFAATSGYALSSGISNLLLLIALTTLPASVQYPIVTGGVIFFSTAVSILLKQKPGKKTILSAVIAFLATLFIIL